VLHDFAGVDCDDPIGGVAIGPDGVLYGTSTYGGTSGYGTVFSLTPPASPSGAWTETVLYSFTGGSDGASSGAGVAVGSGPSGHPVLYGTTAFGGEGSCTVQFQPPGCGTVFSLKP